MNSGIDHLVQVELVKRVVIRLDDDYLVRYFLVDVLILLDCCVFCLDYGWFRGLRWARRHWRLCQQFWRSFIWCFWHSFLIYLGGLLGFNCLAWLFVGDKLDLLRPVSFIEEPVLDFQCCTIQFEYVPEVLLKLWLLLQKILW